jgi:hypothetical protein
MAGEQASSGRRRPFGGVSDGHIEAPFYRILSTSGAWDSPNRRLLVLRVLGGSSTVRARR